MDEKGLLEKTRMQFGPRKKEKRPPYPCKKIQSNDRQVKVLRQYTFNPVSFLGEVEEADHSEEEAVVHFQEVEVGCSKLVEVVGGCRRIVARAR